MAGKTKWILSMAVVLATGAQASASIWINEFMINAPGGGDNGFEFVELKSSSSSMSLTGLSLVYLEGGPGAANMGDVDNIVNLGLLSTGTNGLLLLRDAAGVLNPAPNPATTVSVGDFNPDLENGGASILLVDGFTGNLSTDIDSNNDGIIDSTPWTSVIDALGWHESSDTPPLPTYAGQLGGIQFSQQSWTPDAMTRIDATSAYFHDVLGSNPGPYSTSDTEIGPSNPGAPFNLTPGSENAPEPTSLALLALGLAMTAGRRNRR